MSGDICYYCDGTGYRNHLEGSPCHECGGTGWLEQTDESEDQDEVSDV